MQLLSAKNNSSVLLEVARVNKAEGKGTNVATYLGYMSHKHLYVRLIHEGEIPQDFPEYLRIKRSLTGITEKCRDFAGMNGASIVRTLEYPEGSSFGNDGRISLISEGTPEAKLIDDILPSKM